MFTCKAVIQYVFLKFVIRYIKLLKKEWLSQFSGVMEANRSLWQAAQEDGNGGASGRSGGDILGHIDSVSKRHFR